MSVELLRHRDLLEKNDNYGVSYSRLYNSLKDKFLGQDVPERLLANMAQILTVPYTLQCMGKVNLLDFETASGSQVNPFT